MSYCIKIKAKPSTNKNQKLYIYRSKNSADIDTIAKIKNLQPIIVIDELTYDTANMEDGYYVVNDMVPNPVVVGVTYVGPEPVSIPINEYEGVESVHVFNTYTHSMILKLSPLGLSSGGMMYYYSIIGVDEVNQTITHLSKVQAELLLSDYTTEGTREIFACDNYSGLPTDSWYSIGTADWNTEIILGDMNNPILYNRFGIPFVKTPRIFASNEVVVDTRCASIFKHITVRIPNVWQLNNEKYNKRKLKSFKIRNIYNGKYGEFSEPTYQSLYPVTNERMLIYRKDMTTEAIKDSPIGIDDTTTLVFTIVRKNGLYYLDGEHRILGFNKYNLEEAEKIGVFSESSIQEFIPIEFEANGGSTYNYTFYIQDVYGNYSEPTVLLIET